MACTIKLVGDDVTLAEEVTFNKVRHRYNKAVQEREDYRNGNYDALKKDSDGNPQLQPAHDLSFETIDGGRISFNIDKYIGVYSPDAKD